MSKRSEIVMNRQDKLTIPIVRRQLDFILKKEKGSTLKDFVGVIHENAMKGYKRSSIPTAHDVDGEGKLKEINKVTRKQPLRFCLFMYSYSLDILTLPKEFITFFTFFPTSL